MDAFSFNLNDFTLSLISILLEGIPFLLFGTLISGLIDAFVPSKLIHQILPRDPRAAVMLSGLLGIIFPMCECGIVPVLRRLIQKGVPTGCAIAYMLAAPIVNPITFISTLAAFKGQDPWLMTLLRMAFGFIISVLAGWIVLRLDPKKVLRESLLATMPRPGAIPVSMLQADGKPMTFATKCVQAIRCSVNDFLDVLLYLIVGASLAAIFNTALNRAILEPFATNPFIASISLMVMAVMLSLCSTSDAFIAASLTLFPASAKLAFLVFGPMFDCKLALMYSAVFQRSFVWKLALGLALATLWLCLMFHFKPA